MSYIAAIAQVITIIFVLLYEYKKRCLSMFIWATLLLMFGLPHLISVFAQTTKYNDEVMIKASLFVILFNIIYLIFKISMHKVFGMSSFSTNVDFLKENERNLNKYIKIDKRASKLFFLMLIMSLATLIIYGVSRLGSIRNISWGTLYLLNRSMGSRSAIYFINFILFSSAGVLLYFSEKKMRVKYVISTLVILSFTMLSGNRITILPIMISIIIPFVFKKANISIKKIIILSLLGFFSIYLVYSLRLLRIYGGFLNLLSQLNFLEVNKLVLNMILEGDGEMSLRNAFYHFIYYDNNFENFNSAHTYIRLILIAIPSSLSFGLKPPDFAISMGSAWIGNPSNTIQSMHPTLYGDVFANLYWYGVFLGIFWAILTFLTDRFIMRQKEMLRNLLMVLFGTVYVICARGSVYNAYFQGFVGTIIIFGIYFISSFKFVVRLRKSE